MQKSSSILNQQIKKAPESGSFFQPRLAKNDIDNSPSQDLVQLTPIPGPGGAKHFFQPKLRINEHGDSYEKEADAVADRIMSKNDSFIQPKTISNIERKCDHCEEEKNLQAKEDDDGVVSSFPEIDNYASDLDANGQPLLAHTRQFFEPRFGYDFSNVKVHTNDVAAKSAQAINALAYTTGNNIVFNRGEFSPGTDSGKKLLAHELTHVVQQASYAGMGSNKLLQRQQGAGGQAATTPQQRLEFLPSLIPCACLVFIHNNERNARWAAETLHRNCHYNLAIIGRGQSRNVPVRGTNGPQDPNELFPASIQEECTRNETACVDYERNHNDLRAMQIQFFLTIKSCTENFQLPTVALHNNTITDTGSFLRGTTSTQRQGLRGDFSRQIDQGIGSREDLRNRLGKSKGIMDRSKTTNIFRWCNLPEITRCHVGDPDHPDDVVWVTNVQDFDTLRQQNVNVVLQEGLSATSGSESETDLSTLFLRLGPDARFINIETPITPKNQATRDRNLLYIQQVLDHIGLNCCEPIGDFPTPSRTEMYA